MWNARNTLLIPLAFAGQQMSAQFADSCFTSMEPGTSFPTNDDIGSLDGDLLEWTGFEWIGDWPNAQVTLPPPANGTGCRVIFIGSGTVWTTGGEGFAIRLLAPLVGGETYTYTFLYVSHGTGSDGAFTFDISSNTAPFLGGSFIASVPPVGYTWTSNTITFTATAAQSGNEWIIIHNGSNGTSGLISSYCSACAEITLPCPPLSLGPDLEACEGVAQTLTASVPDATYLWSNGSTNDSLTVSSAGTYWLQATTPDCVLRDTVNVLFTPAPEVALPTDLAICEEDSVLLVATNDSASYLWSTGATSATIWAHPPGDYSVVVSIGPCTDADAVTITAQECSVSVELPNVFSPNGDGENDTFEPLVFEGMLSASLSIYNRWGMLIETVGLPTGWNGRHNGDHCPEGTYFWTLHAQPLEGSAFIDHGSLTLVR